MPLVATFLFYRAQDMEATMNDALWPRLLPGLYLSVLGLISLFSLSYIVRHPHDVRTSGNKLKEAVERENRRYKEIKQKKKKKRKQILEQKLDGSNGFDFTSTVDDGYVPPTV